MIGNRRRGDGIRSTGAGRMLPVLALAAVLAAACGGDAGGTATGRVRDADGGAAVSGAVVMRGERWTSSTDDGYFALEGVRSGDTLTIACDGFIQQRLVVGRGTPASGYPVDVWLHRVPDTAWTAEGPVDASIFLDDTRLHRKKLSQNEAREIVQRLLPEARFRRGRLVVVNDVQEWMFEFRIGHADGAVYLNAWSGEIRSAESEDVMLDRRLQDMLRQRSEE